MVSQCHNSPAFVLPTGTLLSGRFRLQREIARGRAATVYLAFDTQRATEVAVRVVRLAAQEQARQQGVQAETVLVEFPPGRVADSIVEQAVQHGCDLIVMGSHGRRGLRRMMLGSDAELVLRTSRVPVLVVHQPPAHPG